MATHVDLDAVRMWYDELGSGEPFVVLHPGLVDARALSTNVRVLADHFYVCTPERQGHGHMPDVDGPISFDIMADDPNVAATDTPQTCQARSPTS
jgi:hypothetical protein